MQKNKKKKSAKMYWVGKGEQQGGVGYANLI